jgi:hypothetical protein
MFCEDIIPMLMPMFILELMLVIAGEGAVFGADPDVSCCVMSAIEEIGSKFDFCISGLLWGPGNELRGMFSILRCWCGGES